MQTQVITDGDPTSPLLRLPAELRNYIYAYALGGQTIILEYFPGDGGFATTYGGTSLRNFLSLLRVCRQIHQETAMSPYALNQFCFVGPGSLDKFLDRRTETQLRSIRAIWLDMRVAVDIAVPRTHAHLAMDPSISHLDGLETLELVNLMDTAYDRTLTREFMRGITDVFRAWIPNLKIKGFWIDYITNEPIEL